MVWNIVAAIALRLGGWTAIRSAGITVVKWTALLGISSYTADATLRALGLSPDAQITEETAIKIQEHLETQKKTSIDIFGYNIEYTWIIMAIIIIAIVYLMEKK